MDRAMTDSDLAVMREARRLRAEAARDLVRALGAWLRRMGTKPAHKAA